MPTTLYRYFDDDDRLLYVGISKHPIDRLGQHKADKSWWEDIAFVSMEHYDTREQAAAAEVEAIKTEFPLHNMALREHHEPADMPWGHLPYMVGAEIVERGMGRPEDVRGLVDAIGAPELQWVVLGAQEWAGQFAKFQRRSVDADGEAECAGYGFGRVVA